MQIKSLLTEAAIGTLWGMNDSIERNLPLSQGAAVGAALLSLSYLATTATNALITRVAIKRNWKIVNLCHISNVASLANRLLIVKVATASGLIGTYAAALFLTYSAIHTLFRLVNNQMNTTYNRPINLTGSA